MGVSTSPSAEMRGELADWGFRAGAGEGECRTSGLWLCKEPVKTGIWECTPGGFDVKDRDNTESVMILSGKVRITNLDDGTAKELGPDDGLVLPQGCSVRWEVLEVTRKFFTISPMNEMGTASSFSTATSAEMLGDLADWGFRVGAGEGECRTSGLWLCKEPVKTGIWECTPGGFDVKDRENTESVMILSGKVRITNLDDGTSKELGPGDGLVLPKGCSVRWDVLEVTRKFFNITP